MSGKKRNDVVGLGTAGMIVLVILAWMVIGAGCQSCTESGGQYVRGVIGYECIGVSE